MKISEMKEIRISVDLKIGNDVEQLDLADLTSIVVENLPDEMAKIPAIIAFYSILSVKASRREQDAKARLELLEAQLDSEYRTIASKSDKKVTEKLLSGQIRLDKRYEDANNMWLNAWEEYQILQKIVGVLEKKAMMLQSLNADRRLERQAYMNAGGEKIEGNNG
jgi:hypothetical protein